MTGERPPVRPAPAPDAFAFRSPLSLAQMKTRLEATTSWPWREGDKAYFDYLAAETGSGSRGLRLYPEGVGFVLQVRRGPMDEAIRRLILDRILPALDATGVAPAEGFD